MRRRDKEPKIVRIEHPGERFWEQIEGDEGSCYVFYRPPDKIKDIESIEYDHFHPSPTPDENVTIHYVPLKKCPWPLPGKPIKPRENLWEEVHGFTYRHVDLPDERLYDITTAWIFCTWIIEAWIAVPYIHLLGPKKSGKTRLLEVLKHLCYRGLLSANISEAALFRSVEAFKPTLLLDETEIYGKENRDAVQNLLNSGYRRGQYVIRVGGMVEGRPKLDLFEVFGFKALAGTGGFKDTLESRSIRFNMEKNVRPVEVYLDEEKAKELRSQLLHWRFKRLSDISDVSDITPRVVPKELSFADGRFLELYTPLLTVCNHGSKDILSYARDSYSVMLDEEQTSEEAQILTAILKCHPNLESGKFSTVLVKENFNEGRSEKEQWGSRSIGKLIKRLGFNPKRLTGGGRAWVWEKGRIQRLCKRYGLTPELTSLTSLTSLREQTEDLVRTLSDICTFEAGGPVTENTLLQRLQEKNPSVWTQEYFSRVLEIVERDGVVYRPRPGFLGAT